MSKKLKSAKASAAAALLVVALAACGGEQRQEQASGTASDTEQTATASATESTSTWITGEQRPPIATTDVGQTVIVSIDDNNIGMPSTVVPGPVVFTVTNAGTKEHDFQVSAGGTQIKKLDAPLQPKQTASLSVDMPAGTYTISCPVEGHEEAGEKVTVTAQK